MSYYARIPLAQINAEADQVSVWKWDDDETHDPFVYALTIARGETMQANLSREEATALRDALTQVLEGA